MYSLNMNYKGVIIQESLQDTSLLQDVNIIKTKVEPVTKDHQTPWLKQWTLHTIEIPEEKADEIADKLSHSFDKKHPDWYADYKNEKFHYIIYQNKVFRVDIANPVSYKEAKKYGISLGIPAYQVDFAPDDRVWKR